MRIHLPRCWDEVLLSLLAEAGLGMGVSETRFESGALEGDAPQWERQCEVRILLPSAKVDEVAGLVAGWMQDWGVGEDAWGMKLRPQEVGSEEDADAQWRTHWRPFRCAGFAIFADFHPLESLCLRPSDLPLMILAGSAFGSGGHASTRMALRALVSLCQEERPSKLLDVGTGSGILAVAAALLGVQEVVGMDPDPASPPQARATAEKNGVGAQCQFWRGGYTSAAGQWPLVMANLVADLLEEGAADLAALVAPGGTLFAGGIMEHAWDSVAATFSQQGMRLCHQLARGRWRAGVWAKP